MRLLSSSLKIFRLWYSHSSSSIPSKTPVVPSLISSRSRSILYDTKMQINVDSKNPPAVVLLTVNHLNESAKRLEVKEGEKSFISVNNEVIEGENVMSRYLARTCPSAGLYGKTPLESSQVDSWLDFSVLYLKNCSDIKAQLDEINKCLTTANFLVGYGFTLADFAIWSALIGNREWQQLINGGGVGPHIDRWFKYCNNQEIFKSVTKKLNSSVPDTHKEKLKMSMEDGGKFFELAGAEKGKVVVRFPPEASGFLHIGHAKAALLNQYYKDLYDGKLIMRFDDTNPAKENAEFEKIILEDIKLLELTPDCYTRTSDYFDVMFKYAEQLIKQGDAYVDNTPADEMKKLREQRLPSVKRDQSVEENTRLFSEMQKGTSVGLASCLRAKIDYNSDNGCLRDPVLYRCRDEDHLMHGDKYKAYPTYDFACPIVDSLEDVTHALRTTEYLDRDQQYYWIIDKLGIRKPSIYSYARLALVNTVLSKRKLTYLVNEGYVDGWDDPRMPTVRGVLRRGMTINGLREFIVAQGSSKSNVHMEWDKIWSFNKKVIDPIAPRYNALLKDEVVVVKVNNATQLSVQYPKHPKNADIGEKPVYYSSKVFIEGSDAQLMKEGDLVTFINWGNLRIKKTLKEKEKITSIEADLELENKDFKKTLKITWLADHEEAPLVPTVCSYFENVINKPDMTRDDDFKQYINKDSKSESVMLGDPCLASLKKGEIIQLQRRGYFICDSPYIPSSRHSGKASPCLLFHIPDGTTTGMMNKGKEKGKASGSSTKSKNSVEKEISNDLKKSGQGNKGKSKKDSATKIKEVNEARNVSAEEHEKLFSLVLNQGNLIRQLKSSGATKEKVLEEVTLLKQLKGRYKEATGVEFVNPTQTKPSQTQTAQQPAKNKMAPVSSPSNVVTISKEGEALKQQIIEQGNKIREIKKDSKSTKEILQPEIDFLLKLKSDYKVATGEDYQPPNNSTQSTRNKKGKKEKGGTSNNKKEVDAVKSQAQVPSGTAKKVTRLGLEAKKEEALSDWYSQVITKSELIEYYDVSGCYILRPWAFSIWEKIVSFFDEKIKKLGVENCYFPMFVSHAALEREKDHIADFAPEVAWVTKSGQSELAEPIAIRPTSETVMYPSYAKWVQSHRDLPIRLNQWCNVVRWEFKHPQPFLRTREFLWQEGHSAFATKEEACEEVYTILDLYARVYTDLLAIPVVKGRKTEKEKFAGGDFTTTVEAYIDASGRAIQGATSHHLGQNFSKMFDITFEDPSQPGSKEKSFVYQNSWGLTTRSIGVLVMVHGDNIGLVLPPRVAQFQVVIVPVGISANTTDKERKLIKTKAEELKEKLSSIRVKLDDRENYSSGWKFNHWELKGVPLRIELGPRDIEKNEFVAVRRDTFEKLSMSNDDCEKKVEDLLEVIQSDMYARASKKLVENTCVTTSWEEFLDMLDKKKIIKAPFCEEIECEETIKKNSAREDVEAGAPSMGAKSLCIPFEQPREVNGLKCVNPSCGKPAKSFTLFGRSY